MNFLSEKNSRTKSELSKLLHFLQLSSIREKLVNLFVLKFNIIMNITRLILQKKFCWEKF